MATFEQTQNLVSFMKANKLTTMRVVDNKKTGKLFGADSKSNTYRLSDKVNKIDKDNVSDLSVSWFTPQDGEASWLIHPTGVSNANTVSEFSLADLEQEVGVF
jgi:ribosomal protein L2